MPDQTTPPTHKCNDEAARVRLENLEQQRKEDRGEISAAMKSTNDLVKGMDGKLDRVLHRQGENSTAIAVLTTRIDHIAATPYHSQPITHEEPVIDRRQGGPITVAWETIPPWIRALIYLALGALGAGGGLSAVRSATPAVETAAPGGTQVP